MSKDSEVGKTASQAGEDGNIGLGHTVGIMRDVVVVNNETSGARLTGCESAISFLCDLGQVT